MKASARLGAVILAAGASTRMKQPKQLLPFAGQPLLLRTVDALLAAPVWPVVVVLGAHAEKIRPLLARYPVLVAENPAWAEGMASSLRTGIAVLQQFSRSLDGALITLCDQPAFSADIARQLIDAFPRSAGGIVAARYHDRHGAPALFSRDHFPALAALTGEAGARTLINAVPEKVVAIDLPQLGIDLDTPEDYAAAKPSAGDQP